MTSTNFELTGVEWYDMFINGSRMVWYVCTTTIVSWYMHFIDAHWWIYGLHELIVYASRMSPMIQCFHYNLLVSWYMQILDEN